MRLKSGTKGLKDVKDFHKDHYLTSGQIAKVLGVHRDTIHRRKSQYVHVDHINTPHGMLWNRYQVYKHLLPRASDDVISKAILDDRDKIQTRRRGLEKALSKIKERLNEKTNNDGHLRTIKGEGNANPVMTSVNARF